MNTNPSLSVIIVTKNRPYLLAQALASLVGQCGPRDEIIIVDASARDTLAVIPRFRPFLPIKHIRYYTPGYPLFYNKGAAAANGDILVFYDDDCIASPTFLRAIRTAHRRHPDSVIQGYTHSIPRGNLYVDIMSDHYGNWLATMALPHHTLTSFDSKNASIPRQLFRRHGGLSRTMIKGSEDIELGIRLRRRGIPIYLEESIVAYHHERTTLTEFLAQHYRFAQSEGSLDKILPKQERLGVIPRKKLFLHLRSFAKRESGYIRRRNLRNACVLPLLYAALACIRVWGYATNR